jgi:hypothetical protein
MIVYRCDYCGILRADQESRMKLAKEEERKSVLYYPYPR